MKSRTDLLLIDPTNNTKAREKLVDMTGLGHLASYASAKGFKVKLVVLLDFNSKEKLKNLVQETQPILVGLPTFTYMINFVSNLAGEIKRISSSRIVMGGPHVSFCAREFIERNSFVDFVIKGEGELKLVKLLEFLVNSKGSLKKIPGLVYREKNKVIEVPGDLLIKDLNELPPPKLYTTSAQIRLNISRGCAFSCKFCLWKEVTGRRLRCKSPDKAAEDIIRAYKDKKHSKIIVFNDSAVNFNSNTFIATAKKLKESNIKAKGGQINIAIQASLSTELLKITKEIGIDSVGIGIESGSVELRQLAGKFFSDSEVFTAVRKIKAIGLLPKTYFIIGLPGENWRTLLKTFNMIIGLSKEGSLIEIYPFMPFIGTEFYEYRKNFEFEIIDWNYDHWTGQYVTTRTKSLSEEDLASAIWSIRAILVLLRQRSKKRIITKAIDKVKRRIPSFLWVITFFAGFIFSHIAKFILVKEKNKIPIFSKGWYHCPVNPNLFR